MTKLLIVDDNEQDLYMLQVLLEGNGYEVVTATNGVEALKDARRDPPDMIIADILMPAMDGFSLCREWKRDERLKEIPFVFYTATYTDPKDEELALNLGAERFIVKPVEPDVFVGMLREVIEEHKAGRLVAPREPVAEESVYLKEYNEALIRKLEDKILQLEQANQTLERHSQELEQRVAERAKELRDAQEQLVRQEKLIVLGQLASGVAHELRNPLGAIKNAAYFLNMVLEEPAQEVKEALEILEKEVGTSEGIISSLLDFARPKPLIRRKVNINDVVAEALSRSAVPENVEVVSQLNESLPAILADPDKLEQVFGNIILNAIQAMPEGGQLAIKSETASPEWIAVSLTDTGMGIPPENMGKLFEPLFTTRAKGIGLGLALTKTIVEGHGGVIEVQSEVGKGSVFTVRLPINGEG